MSRWVQYTGRNLCRNMPILGQAFLPLSRQRRQPPAVRLGRQEAVYVGCLVSVHALMFIDMVEKTHLTSSRIVVKGNSGPYLSLLGSPSLAVTGLAVPYGLPRLFMQTMKNLEVSNTRPGPPRSGPHQSLTSALPVRAWQITMALSPLGDSLPLVVYAKGTLLNVTPDSSVKDGIMANSWSGIRLANGFSGCCRVLAWKYQPRSFDSEISCNGMIKR